jgi:hypothetical protein
MSIKYILGLVACLNYQGPSIPEEDAMAILEGCEEIKRMPLNEFNSFSTSNKNKLSADTKYDANDGEIMASVLGDYGLKIKYSIESTHSQKRSIILKACDEFYRDYQDNSNWKNLGK